jgi:IPT/TIG domain
MSSPAFQAYQQGYWDQSYPADILNGGGGPGPDTDPAILSLTPNSISIANGIAQVVTITGFKFVAGSIAEVDGAAQSTTFVNVGSLTFVFDPTGKTGTVQVTVRNPDDAESNDAPLTVTA